MLMPVGAAVLAVAFTAMLLRGRHWLGVACIAIVVGAVVLVAAVLLWGAATIDNTCP